MKTEPADTDDGPSLDVIRTCWPATVSVSKAAKAFGISTSHAYALVRSGDFPARTLPLGNSIRVVTASIVEVLGG